MKSDERILELHPRLSKCLDSLCFELSVSVPDENSLQLLQIVKWYKNGQIIHEELKQLYQEWLRTKNVYELEKAKQINIFPKCQLIDSDSANINEITKTLEIINNLYNELYLSKKHHAVIQKKVIDEIQQIFSFLDHEGILHLRLSQLFFLTGALLICQNYTIPLSLETFRVEFKSLLKQLCEIDGKVSLRCFKNYFIHHPQRNIILKHILNIFKECIKIGSNISKNKVTNDNLPSILDEALVRWKSTVRFNNQYESKKKIESYKRVFEENQSIFFFNGTEESLLNENYFIKLYGEQFVRCLEIDSIMLKQFQDILKNILNQYVTVFSKVSNVHHSSTNVHHPSSNFHPSHTTNKSNQNVGSSAVFNSISLSNYEGKRKKNASELYNSKEIKLETKTSIKDKTPKKKTRNANYDEKKHVTPTHRISNTSPFINRQFGSTEKSVSKNKYYPRDTTPPKSMNYYQSGYPTPLTQTYKGAKKEGLEKDSFYQRLFFFRNKRVESYDVVMKRLKGK